MSDKVCEKCGHCKECGRGGYVPYYPWWVHPYQQYPSGWWYNTTTSGAAGNVSTGWVAPVSSSFTQASQNTTPTFESK